MKVKYYEDADLLSIRLSKENYFSASKQGDFIVHNAKDGEVVLIEILNASNFIKEVEEQIPKKNKKENSSKNDIVMAVSHRIR